MSEPTIKWKDFLPWLRAQPKDRSFNYQSMSDCMVCNFLKETQGIEFPNVEPYRFKLDGKYVPLPEKLACTIRDEALKAQPDSWKRLTLTCGQVLEAFEALEKQNVQP